VHRDSLLEALGPVVGYALGSPDGHIQVERPLRGELVLPAYELAAGNVRQFGCERFLNGAAESHVVERALGQDPQRDRDHDDQHACDEETPAAGSIAVRIPRMGTKPYPQEDQAAGGDDGYEVGEEHQDCAERHIQVAQCQTQADGDQRRGERGCDGNAHQGG